MACPYGVLRFHEESAAPPGKTVAVKCDNCDARVARGKIPACVEVCKTGALIYDEMTHAMNEKTRQVARTMSADAATRSVPDTVALYNTMKQAAIQAGTAIRR
jgi:carbon-monoxide dehydrogenase iron sulfur subunit